VALAQRILAERSVAPAAAPLTEPRIRRCTFRRLHAAGGRGLPMYDVECLYPDRKVPIPLGDLETARPICNGCAAAHIFRPDED
jgi:hypothetical protein